MKGKNKCRILKEIRQRIADENDIPYVTRECAYQGECAGTCPKCEEELRYLERELEKRRSLGKRVAVTAVAAGLSLSLSACVPGFGSGEGVGGSGLQGAVEAGTESGSAAETTLPALPELQGDLRRFELEGELAAPTEDPEQTGPEEETGDRVELMGDVDVIRVPDTTAEQ